MDDGDPGGNDLVRKINRRAQFSLINHEKYKYNDLCILFMDGMVLWRDGNIQIGLQKYPMTWLTRQLVAYRYKKLYRNGENFLRTAFRYFIMTSTVSGLFWVGVAMRQQNQQYKENRLNNTEFKIVAESQEQYRCDSTRYSR